MVIGTQVIEGVGYTFDGSGALVGTPPASSPTLPADAPGGSAWEDQGYNYGYAEQLKGTWVKVTDPIPPITWNWYYRLPDGTNYAGWLIDQGKIYYLNALDDSYLDGSGKCSPAPMCTGWFSPLDGYSYYAKPDGSVATGTTVVDAADIGYPVYGKHTMEFDNHGRLDAEHTVRWYDAVEDWNYANRYWYPDAPYVPTGWYNTYAPGRYFHDGCWVSTEIMGNWMTHTRIQR
jgi:hypothetical protein